MTNKKIPSKLFSDIKSRFPQIFEAHENLGSTIRNTGPLDEKSLQLIQLAAAGAIQSEGAVHSHTRRALQAGASEDEIYHALLTLISTIGFPRVMATLSWARDILNK